MSDTKVYLIYFSPGGTTRKTVRILSESFDDYEIIEIDMLKKENRNKQYTFRLNDIVILGLMTLVKPFGPVKDIFKAIRGNNTPLIGIVMFGNGMYGNSLKVVNREVKKRGFCMIAGGAFVGAMSYNRTVAANRPDETDTEKIRLFGDAINNKLKTNGVVPVKSRLRTDWPKSSIFHAVKTALMLYMPLGKIKVSAPLNRIEFTDNCVECGLCQSRCPVGAINLAQRFSDSKLCIGCVACVNGCKNGGIEYTNKLMIKAADACINHFKGRREPETFV